MILARIQKAKEHLPVLMKNIHGVRLRGGVKLISRLSSNFVVHRCGIKYRKEDILNNINPIKRTIDGRSCVI